MTFEIKIHDKHHQELSSTIQNILNINNYHSTRVKENLQADLIKNYNTYINYIKEFYDKLHTAKKRDIENDIKIHKIKLNDCFKKLKIKIQIPKETFQIIETDSTSDNKNKTSIAESQQSTSSTTEKPTSSQSTEEVAENPVLKPVTITPQPKDETPPPPELKTTDELTSAPQKSNNITSNNSNKKIKMVLEVHEFAALAAKQLNLFSGNPLELDSFINSINLLKEIGTATHSSLLKKIILTKLSGKALECVPTDVADVDAIITALRANIKPDNSKIVEGKMLALKLDQLNTSDFAKEAERLAEALQRTLIVEGITQVKAKSMAVEKTVEICRQATKSSLVRSVLASSTFDTPQEVVAKFIIENTNDIKEKPIFKFTHQKDRYNNRNSYNSYRNNNSNWRGSNNSNFRNNSFTNQNKRNNNFRRNRGRGNGKFYNNNIQNDRFVRITNSGNLEDPSMDRRETNEAQISTFQAISEN